MVNEQLPDDDSLARGILSALVESGNGGGPVAVLRREPGIYSSAFPTELVNCRADGDPFTGDGIVALFGALKLARRPASAGSLVSAAGSLARFLGDDWRYLVAVNRSTPAVRRGPSTGDLVPEQQ